MSFTSLTRSLLPSSNGVPVALALWLTMGSQAIAMPMTVSYEDTFGGAATMTVSNDTAFSAATADYPRVMTLPQFNPAFGTLLSARFAAYVNLDYRLVTQCQDIIYCNTWADGGAASHLSLQEASYQLGVDLGPNLAAVAGATLSCSDAGLLAYCSQFRHRFIVADRDLTFAGVDLAGFIGTGVIGFYQNHGGSPIGGSLSHSGIPNTHANDGTDAAGDGGPLPDIISTAYDVWSTGLGDNGPVYSYATQFASSTQIVDVVYTYEPRANAVPEPPVLALLALGFAGLGAFRCRKRH